MYQSIISDPGGDRIVRIVSNIQCVNGSILLVPADSVAYFVCNGIISQPYLPGRYEVNTGISPFFVRLRNIMTNGNPAITVSVFFVATKIENVIQMGTGDVIFKENRFNLLIKALSSFSIRFLISDSLLFVQRLVGMHTSQFSQEDLEPAIKALILLPIRQSLGRYFSRTSVSDFHNNLSLISNNLTTSLRPVFSEYGISLRDISIIGINIPDTELERLRELETEYARGILQTDVEKHNISQIYGNVDKRTLIEVMTGLPRGTAQVNNCNQVPQGSVGGMAGVMASLPLQMAVINQMASVMREPVAEMTRQSNLFSRNEPGSRESENHESDTENGPISHTYSGSIVKPALPKKTIKCRSCGALIPVVAFVCPVCKSNTK